MNETTVKQKCIDAGINYTNVRSYKYKHKDLSYEQIIERYKNYCPQNYAANRLGEISESKIGLKIKLIRYINSHNIDVQFEDGTIVEHKTYTNFKKGCIPHPKYKKVAEAYTFKGERFLLVTCKVCKKKHILNIKDMKEFECDTKLYNG